ncbi:N-acetylmuramoyl-L-alanine amidase AmiD precursor [Roseovarius aestuarii]|uniref:N-acetylmuramoyl-L-alanine amidase n=2 Tax=Roseovarius aestuarii TaxID=475083 RepID=A0A1X7BNS1_9RHOB|nr:N-acetylmuramoyl-L-alanine amidase AmiD precursor [Roseovarius aestuarii]
MGPTPLEIEQHPSPNYGARSDNARPDMIVLHYTAMETARAALERLCDPETEVSAHYLIGETGHVWQLIPEEQRAWHAGAGQWGDVTDVNSRSIGIELANCGDHPFPDPQMAALEYLLAQVMERWAIPPERIIGHSDMAIGRKTDPGPRFDWRRLAQQDLSVWSEARTCAGDFAADARAFGYAPADSADAVLSAVRLRFRPWATGPIDDLDRAIMHDLASRYPIDRKAFTA